MSVFFKILLISLIEFIGDSSLKIYARNGGNLYLISGIASYVSVVLFLIYILKHTNVVYMNLQWDALSAIIETLLAFIILRETLSNNFQYAGMILMITGVILLNIGKVPV